MDDISQILNDAGIAPTEDTEIKDEPSKDTQVVQDGDDPAKELTDDVSTDEGIQGDAPKDDDGKEEAPKGGVDLSEFGYESPEQLKAELQLVKDLKEQNETLRQSVESMKSIKYPKIDPKFYRLQKLQEENKGDYKFYEKLVLGNADPIEVVKLSLMQKHPDIFTNEEEALAKVARKYPAIFEGYTKEDQEYKDALTDLKLEADDIKKSYMEKFNNIEVPDFPDAEKAIKEKQAEVVKNWKPIFPELSNKFGKVPIEIKNGDKQEMLPEIEIPKEELKPIVEQVAAHVLSNGFEVNEESKASVMNYAKILYIANNLTKYNTHIYNKAREAADKAWKSKVHNPQGLKTETKPVDDNSADAVVAQILNDYSN